MNVKIKISSLVCWGLLLVVGQLLLTQWTIHAAGNRDVLDYISFAGTVIGMVLAVLAIVYSFISNASQKTDSEFLRSQIFSLNDAISRANQSGNDFSRELGRLEEIRESLSELNTISSTSLDVTNKIAGKITALENQTAQKPDDVGGTEHDTSECLELIASRALPLQIIQYYLASRYENQSSTAAEEDQEALLFAILKAEDRRTLRAFLSTGQHAYFLIFLDLRVFKDAKAQKRFKEALLSRARSELDRADQWVTAPSFSLDSMKSSISKITDRLHASLSV